MRFGRPVPSALPLFTALIFLAVPVRVQAQSALPPSRLVEQVGAVEVSPAGTGRWQAATPETKIGPGDRLRTGPQGGAEVRVGTTNLFLAASSDLVLGPPALPRSLRLLRGEVWAERSEGPGRFALEGGRSRARFSTGRVRLERSRDDSWSTTEGALEIESEAGATRRSISAGQSLRADSEGLQPPRPLAPTARRNRGADRLDAKSLVSRRSTVAKLLAAQRRLVRLSEDRGGTTPEWSLASEQLGKALGASRRELAALIDRRSLSRDGRVAGRRLPGATRLLDEMTEALSQHAALSTRLAHLDRSAVLNQREPPGLATGPESDGAGGTGGSADSAGVAQTQTSMRFLQRYAQALQRFQRIFSRAIQKQGKKITFLQINNARNRIVGGYRQAEAVVMKAKVATRRIPRSKRSPRLEQSSQAMERAWRRVGRDFRIIQGLIRQLIALKQANKKNGPGGGP